MYRKTKLLQPYRQTDGHTDRHTDIQTGRQTDRQAGRQTGRQAGRQTDRITCRGASLLIRIRIPFWNFSEIFQCKIMFFEKKKNTLCF